MLNIRGQIPTPQHPKCHTPIAYGVVFVYSRRCAPSSATAIFRDQPPPPIDSRIYSERYALAFFGEDDRANLSHQPSEPSRVAATKRRGLAA
jgi:hypothetical protein